MTLPDGVTTCTVTLGKALGPLGTEASIDARLTMDRRIVHEATGWTINPADELPEAVGEGGILTFDAPHVDQDGFRDVNGQPVKFWVYTLAANIKFANTTLQLVKRFQVLVGQEVIDLDLVPDDEPTLPPVNAPTPQVSSVAGRSGVVTRDQLLEGLDLADVATSGSYNDLANKPFIPDSPDDIGARPAGAIPQADVTGLVAALEGKLDDAQVDIAGGVMPLDSDRRAVYRNLPAALSPEAQSSAFAPGGTAGNINATTASTIATRRAVALSVALGG